MNKFLIASHVSLFPPEHGGAKSVRHVAESLAASGAEVRVLVKLHPPAPERVRFAGQLAAELPGESAGVRYEGVAGGTAELAAALRAGARAFAPDHVILCDDSPEDGRELFEAAADTGRFVFFAQTVHALPFGPVSIKPSEAVTRAIGRARRLIAPSRFVAGYIRRHLGREAAVFYPDVFGRGPFPALGAFTNRFVTMVNPCAWKGSSILLKLARRRPDVEFAAVPTWGAVPAVMEELKSLPNVAILEETPRIDEIFARTRVLLTPSLCQEAFGLVSPEALLRGVPVIASDIGGLRESTLGAAALIPVRPLPFDAPPGVPFPFVDWQEPDNDVEPWSAALDRVLADEASYAELSARGRRAAADFVEGLGRRSVTALFN